MAPENGEEVYTFKRDGIDVRYSFSYAVDPSDQPASPTFPSSILVLLFKGTPSLTARFIIKEKGKDQLDWTLTSNVFVTGTPRATQH